MARIAAILIGLAIMFALERWGEFRWYSALASSAFGYAIVRYIGYFVKERRHVSGVMDAAKRDQISNSDTT